MHLFSRNIAHTTPDLVVPTPTPRVLVVSSMVTAVSSVIPKKGNMTYATMHDLSALHQAIVTIEDNSDDDDLLYLSDIRVKNKRRRRRQARKIRRLYDTILQERTYNTTKLVFKTYISSIATATAKDRSDQKSYTEYCFNAESSPINLTDNLNVESLVRSTWTNIIGVKTARVKIINILDHLALITETEMDAARNLRTANDYNDLKIYAPPPGDPSPPSRRGPWPSINYKWQMTDHHSCIISPVTIPAHLLKLFN